MTERDSGSTIREALRASPELAAAIVRQSLEGGVTDRQLDAALARCDDNVLLSLDPLRVPARGSGPWWDLAQRLGITLLRRLAEKPSDIEGFARWLRWGTLQRWLSQQTTIYSWSDLARALREVPVGALARASVLASRAGAGDQEGTMVLLRYALARADAAALKGAAEDLGVLLQERWSLALAAEVLGAVRRSGLDGRVGDPLVEQTFAPVHQSLDRDTLRVDLPNLSWAYEYEWAEYGWDRAASWRRWLVRRVRARPNRRSILDRIASGDAHLRERLVALDREDER